MSGTIQLVVLAAGASERLGTCKALVPLALPSGTTTPLEHLLTAGAGLCDRPLVVTGKHHDEIARALDALGRDDVELVRNADWERGRTGGLALAHARHPASALCVAPVDVPLVEPAVFATLAASWERAGAPARGWLAPCIVAPEGPPRFGHPVVVGPGLAHGLVDLDPDAPLRRLRERAEPLLAAPVDDRGILDDLDEPTDLAALLRR